MLRLLKNMKSHLHYVVIIILLLVVQAFCDLALPDYTSKIIDTGIQNSGIEHIVPEWISDDEYALAEIFMTDEEKSEWENLYTHIESDNRYEYKDGLKKSQLEDADENLLTALLMNYQLSNVDEKTFREYFKTMIQDPDVDIDSMSTEDLMKMIPGVEITSHQAENTSGELVEYYDIRNVFKAMTESGKMQESDIMKVREEAEDKLSAVGSTMTKSMGVAYAKRCDTIAGLDIEKTQKTYLIISGLKMLAVALILTVCSVIAAYFASIVGSRIGRDLRGKVFSQVVSYSSKEMDKFSTASLITRSTNDIQQIQMVTILLLRMLCYAPILAIGGIIKVIGTHSGMGWVIVLAVAIILCIIAVLMFLAIPKFKIMQKLIDKVNLISREILTGLPVIRAFGREKHEEKRFDEANKNLTKTMLFTNRVMTFMMPCMQMVMFGLSVLIVWVASHKIDNGTIQVGSMTAFITYSMMIVMSFLMLTMLAVMLPRAGVAADRVYEVTSTDSSIKNPVNPEKISTEKGSVEFKNVSFKYENAEENAISNISFKAESGKTTAIIGSTGCGKSTLVNLIPRLYDVTEGEIDFNGVDIRKLDMKELRHAIGYVPQKGILFSGTIAENIKFGNKNASDELVHESAEIAQATEFIEEKYNKYESFISQGGSNVSGGQKQRLSIARAIAKEPAVYIFDDSFSALDLKTDLKLRKALAKKTKNAAVIIVAQRISTIKHADNIIVLDEGKIAGMGTHSELIRNCDVYLQIAKSQFSEKELAEEFGKESE